MRRNEEMNLLIEHADKAESDNVILRLRIADLQKIRTNYRGHYLDSERGQTDIDGNDGWPWHAWSGAVIAYGSTESHAKTNLQNKLADN